MNWKLLELDPGPALQASLWPQGLETFIPVAENLLKPSSLVPAARTLIFGRNDRDEKFPLLWRDANGKVTAAFDIKSWVSRLQEESYREPHACPATAKLPFHYHRVPGFLRNLLASWLLKRNQGTEGRRYPVSLKNSGVELFTQLWERDQTFASTLVLTHDIDTASGFALVEKVAAREKALGFHSSWNIVPKSYVVKHEILRELQQNGFEIGLHGIWHTNREPFLSVERMRKEFSQLRPLIDRYQIKGFRSPSWFRTSRMFDILSEYFTYDTSTLDSDTVCPGGFGGVGVMRPFQIRPNLVELPCTLPFEAPLFFGVRPKELLNYWRPKIDFIKKSGGVLLVNTHPDANYLGNPETLASYFELLQYLKIENWNSLLPAKLVEKFHA